MKLYKITSENVLYKRCYAWINTFWISSLLKVFYLQDVVKTSQSSKQNTFDRVPFSKSFKIRLQQRCFRMNFVRFFQSLFLNLLSPKIIFVSPKTQTVVFCSLGEAVLEIQKPFSVLSNLFLGRFWGLLLWSNIGRKWNKSVMSFNQNKLLLPLKK